MSVRWMLVVIGAVSIAGCSNPRNSTTEGGGAAPPNSALSRCTTCHGDPANGNAAPPTSIHNESETTAIGVGAHQQHLQVSGIRQPIDCSECHVVPLAVNDPGHIDNSTATLTFGPIASAGGLATSYTRAPDGTTATCTVYCHGGAFAANNGANHSPSWTRVDGSQAGCGTCHGIPPPAPHPPAANITSCAQCHPRTVNPDGTIDIGGGRHINGIIDIGTGSGPLCTSCHGDPNRTPVDIAPAPPRDADGNTTGDAVGAHLAHLTGGAIRSALPCEACHTVPTDLSHINGVVDFNFGPLSRTGGVTPTFNATNLTCANYCHGNTALGGSNHAPVWNGGPTQAACGTCHAIPPPAPHPPLSTGSSTTACAACHPGTVKADGTIDTAGGKHINGTVDVTTGNCTVCHGDATRANAALAPAPPKDLSGNTATTAPGVGAHQAHLVAGTIRGPLACSDCHTVPTTLAHATAPLDLTWGALARTAGVTPTFSPTAVTCTNYCHGATLTGGSHATPVWTGGGTEAACGTCHGTPPTSGRHGLAQHAPFINGCATCHGAGYAINFVASGALTTHVDGTRNIDVGAPITTWNPATLTCTANCHTDPNLQRTW